MRVEPSSSGELLAELMALLGSDQLPVQEEVAKAAGVNQSLVSRARNGQLKRFTDKVDALLEYARSRVDAQERALAAAAAVDVEIAQPDPVAGAKRAGVVGAVRRGSRRGDGGAADAYRRQARDGIDAYLEEGYDPRLIVEQLAVLRRAQRLRRAGPSTPSSSDEQVR